MHGFYPNPFWSLTYPSIRAKYTTMPLCFPEKRTSGPEETVAMADVAGFRGVAGIKGVDTLGGGIPTKIQEKS